MASSDLREPRWARHLPWIDGLAALTAGCLELALRRPIGELYGVSLRFVTTIAFCNVGYSLVGLTLGFARRAWLLALLVAANLAWAVVCVLLAVRAPAGATLFAYTHLLGEGAFVVVLAALETRYRRSILRKNCGNDE